MEEVNEKEIVGIDYAKEYEILTYRLKEKEDELYKYKQALLNVCLNMK